MRLPDRFRLGLTRPHRLKPDWGRDGGNGIVTGMTSEADYDAIFPVLKAACALTTRDMYLLKQALEGELLHREAFPLSEKDRISWSEA